MGYVRLIRVLLLGSVALFALATPAAARPPSDFASSYGSGNFGRWTVDERGLPVYRYEVDHLTDPRGAQPELALGDNRRAQHQLGNDNIVASSWNDGYTQLWSQARLPQWANAYEPDRRHYAGGFGYLNVEGKVVNTFWADRPAGAALDRLFGLGYYRKRLRAEGIALREEVYAPFGDDPLLLHDVTIRNETERTRTLSWFEYWDVNPRAQPSTGARPNRGVGAPKWDEERRTLVVDQNADSGDVRPMSIFAAPIKAPVDGFETTIGGFFGGGDRAAPAAVAADRLSGGIAPPAPVGQTSQTLFAFRTPVRLAPGRSVRLRYAYGMANPDDVDALVDRYRRARDPFATSQTRWAGWVPRADFGATRRWVARELAWDAYLLRTASVFEEECGHHTITQGGYYQYSLGGNLGYRSWLHYLLPITYTEPSLAREILRYAIKLQPEVSNENPYGTGALCTRFDSGHSNDLDFWLLLAAAEYGLGSRDSAFFDEQLTFYDTKRQVSAWQHIKLAYRHQESLRGPNGGYRMGSLGDWSDYSTQMGPMTESMLVAAQLAYAYPKLAELSELRGDHDFARELRARAAELDRTLDGAWTGKGWYPRGYFGARQIGKGMPFLEPQPWAILAGVPNDEQARTLVANIRRFLTGHGAPGGPSKIGSALTPARTDPDISERGPVVDPTDDGRLPDAVGPIAGGSPNGPFGGAAGYPGGAWYDPNGWLTWALASLEGVAPDARALAWDEYTRNTLAAHATAFPDHWNGTISSDDVCNAWYSSDASRCGIGVIPTWAGQITEQPTWMVMNALRLAGLTPTRDGYRIDPHLPFERFSLRMPRAGVSSDGVTRRGYLRPEAGGRLTLEVEVPRAKRCDRVQTRVDGRVVRGRRTGRFVTFAGRARRGERLDWAVRCRPAARRR